MFDYLKKFNSLPPDLRAKVSSDDAMNYLSALEHRYRVDLAMVVMKVMVKSLAISDLESTLVSELGLPADRARNLSTELKENIFAPVADYVGLKTSAKSPSIEDDINSLIKEAGITIPSSELVERLKQVLTTYIKGVRQKIDTREILTKDVASGGLGLSPAEIDRVFKVCHRRNYQASLREEREKTSPVHSSYSGAKEKTPVKTDALFKISPEYDLKKALASGETKKISGPLPTAKIAAAEPKRVDIDDLEKQIEVAPPKEVLEDKEASTKPSQTPVSTEKPIPAATVDEPQVVDANKVFTVKKPEETSLFKRLFSESKKKESIAQAKPSKHTAPVPGSSLKPQADLKSTPPQEDLKKASILSAPIPQASPQKKSAGTVVAERVSDKKGRRLDDVKRVPKVMGPLEELQYLDVLNFRRLGKTPAERTTKIFNKVKLLERNGYGKMIEAITAWKKSPVNRLYLHNVQLAMSKGETVKEFVSKNTEAGQNLSFEEIEAIINLNSRLTF